MEDLHQIDFDNLTPGQRAIMESLIEDFRMGAEVEVIGAASKIVERIQHRLNSLAWMPKMLGQSLPVTKHAAPRTPLVVTQFRKVKAKRKRKIARSSKQRNR